MKTVVGIGQCAWDFLALVDTYPAHDTKREALDMIEQGGGPAATALVALRRLGVACRFHGVVGDDEAGRKIVAALGGEGVDASGVLIRPGTLSHRAMIAVERSTGHRTIYWMPPTGERLVPGELGAGFLDGADMLLLDGLQERACLSAAHAARERGVPVMLDAGRIRAHTLDIAALCDYVVGSEEFARELGYAGDAEAFFSRQARRVPGVFTVTLGRRGSVTRTDNGGVFTQPAFEVDVVDTTGAGDVFHAGYVYGVIHGMALKETVRFASAMAALKCRGLGGRSALGALHEIQALLRRGERA